MHSGSLPTQLGLMTALRLLNINSNHISGALPAVPDWFVYLNIANNSLSGTIPTSLPESSALQHVRLISYHPQL